jgi:hypothetical protein
MEDFAKHNARRLLERYPNQLCTFNDDIQGTGAVTLARLLAAVERIGGKLSEQRIATLGAGSAATGISDQLVDTMVAEGQSTAAARSAIWPGVDPSHVVFAEVMPQRPGDSARPWPFGQLLSAHAVRTTSPICSVGAWRRTHTMSYQCSRIPAASAPGYLVSGG